MCGIAGWIGPSGQAITEDGLSRMLAAIARRGPDGEGRWIENGPEDSRVLLGHRRLAIIDLAGGAQPMHRGPLTIVFNGEIYNYRDLRRSLPPEEVQHTDSDTEVLLTLWLREGPACLDRLVGMFAFAVWDRRDGSLTLVRDRWGKKPIMLLAHQGGLAFASEIKGLLALPGVQASLDHTALWQCFAYRYAPGPRTMFQGIEKLPPASMLVWRNGQRTLTRWWRPPDSAPPPAGGGDEAVEVDRFTQCLEEAVRARMVADVPIGAFLSGGIDSAAVVSLMARHSSQPVRTFSVGFDEAGYSELNHAETVAGLIGARHQSLVLKPEAVLEELDNAIWDRDAPVSEPSDIPLTLLARAAASEVKVVLTGEGSDEILAGYPKHRAEALGLRYRMLVPPPLHRALVAPLIDRLPYRFRRIRVAAATMGLSDPRARHPRWFGALSPAERAALVAMPPPHADAVDPEPFEGAAAASPLRRALYFDQTSWLPDNLLERGDRVTMAASLEARMPFLDHRLAAYVASLPDDRRLRGSTTKWLLRRAMERVLPQAILTRPKIGFRVPVEAWFRGRLSGWLEDCLTGAGSRTRDLYRPDALRRVLEEHRAGRVNHEKLLWLLLTTELFRRRYNV
ncbi:MAG: asparagine synthase (glutamine-hydrolyzing) [Alphaproteobacteria bacterium]|nr:MAG: asparagine synthase (glutamine-hydrolyzing) [Alphaproteobacteria bacterium]